ncbi:MAG TPA: hypothetical protein VJT69_19100 [Pyrinomonadaceae bacterium]|nr:hypothetical protein [Pyrinomonadaceae bacterium]
MLTATQNEIRAPFRQALMPSASTVQRLNVQEPIDVEFCHLVTHPESFRDRLVRVKAVFESTFEWSRLYDDACRSSKNYVWPKFECDTIESCEKFRHQLKKDMVGDNFNGKRVAVVLLARFRESNNSKRGFGVQGGLPFQLEILKIEATERIAKTAGKSKVKNRFR